MKFEKKKDIIHEKWYFICARCVIYIYMPEPFVSSILVSMFVTCYKYHKRIHVRVCFSKGSKIHQNLGYGFFLLINPYCQKLLDLQRDKAFTLIKNHSSSWKSFYGLPMNWEWIVCALTCPFLDSCRTFWSVCLWWGRENFHSVEQNGLEYEGGQLPYQSMLVLVFSTIYQIWPGCSLPSCHWPLHLSKLAHIVHLTVLRLTLQYTISVRVKAENNVRVGISRHAGGGYFGNKCCPDRLWWQ